MTLRVVECTYVIMLEASCPVCGERYYYGTEEIAEPMTCEECGCMYALAAPDDEGEVIYER